jgi:hypothetical protein
MSNRFVVSAKECEGLRWQRPGNMAFAASKPLLPLHIGELAGAATSMPMAFTQNEGVWQLVAVCGHTAKHNLFVRDGTWLGAYTPQTLEDWPFELVWVGERGFITFDKTSGALVEKGGDSFFDLEGNMSEALAAVKQRLQASAPKLQATTKAITALHAARVMAPWAENLTARFGDFEFSDLFYMDEQALAKLDDNEFLALRRNGALALGYAVNVSLGQIHVLERLIKLNPTPSRAGTNPADDLEAFFEGDDNLSF